MVIVLLLYIYGTPGDDYVMFEATSNPFLLNEICLNPHDVIEQVDLIIIVT